jgi:hypothetical protein
LIGDHLSDPRLAALETLKQINALFLYTSESPGELPSCVTAICPTEQQLIEEVKYAHDQLSKQMVIFSIYNHKNKEKRDLTHEAGSFLFFQLFKAAFKKLPKNSESKKLMISKCRSYYKGNAKVLKNITDFEVNHKSNEALRWFTKDSFLYRLINKALRTENINTLYHFHFYIVDLSTQLEKEFSKLKKQDPKSIRLFYRGFKTTFEDVKNIERNISSLILTNGYLSATRKRQVAYDYVKKINILPNHVKVLIEYTIDLTLVKTCIFTDISSYNESPDDNEILFDLGKFIFHFFLS